MKHPTTILALCLAAALLIPAGASADCGKDHGKAEQTAKKSGQTEHASKDFTPRLRTADAMIGATVRNTEGKDLGEIKDLVLDSSHRGISYAVLAFGGFMGLGEDLHAIPWQALKVKDTGDDERSLEVVLDATKDQLESAEGFDDDSWPDAGDERWTDRVHASFYGEPSRTDYDTGTDTYDTNDDLTGRPDPTIENRRMTRVIGSEIRNQQGDGIGEIEDLAIDLNQGHVAYAIVDVDDGLDLDLDSEQAAIPWRAVKVRGEELSISMNESALKQMSYQEGQLASLEDRGETERRSRAAQCEPYWMAVIHRPDVESGSDMARSQQTDEQQRRYGAQNSSMLTVKGKVTSLTTEQRDGKEHLRFEILTDDGRRLVIDGGEQSSTDRLSLQEGDQVTVTGMRQSTTGQGTAILTAHTIKAGGETFRVNEGGDFHEQHQDKPQHKQHPDNH